MLAVLFSSYLFKLIFSVHLSKLPPDNWQNFNISILSQESKNFSGAEIQQSIIEGMHIAFNENREFTTNDIRRGLKEIIPISKMNFEEIESIKIVHYLDVFALHLLYNGQIKHYK